MSSPSKFIRPMHPKTDIRPRPEAMQKILDLGWVAQAKIHGHRLQLHVPADPAQPCLCYNRQGAFHARDLDADVEAEIRRVFTPQKGWNVIDGEWLKDRKKIYVFDFIKKDGELLRGKNFLDRFALLPREFLSPHLQVLPLLKTLEDCQRLLEDPREEVEGLVFKSNTTKGFADTSIVRCRKSLT